ncbi:MAG: hypothetical protein OXI63_00415 [Candidatus Poribacteria bacterium]|nr:hypothetical protein [Candidatus Poribacteria bacterium]
MAKHQRRNRKHPNLRREKHQQRQHPVMIPVSIEKVGEGFVVGSAPYDPNRADEYHRSFNNSLKVFADEHGVEHLSKELALEEKGHERLDRAPHRLKELEEEYRASLEKVISRYSLSASDRKSLKRDWELSLKFIAMYEDAMPEELRKLRECKLHTYASESLNDYIDFGGSEAYWRASFDLQNALGLGMVTINATGSINGETFSF